MRFLLALLLPIILPASFLWGQVEPPSNQTDFLKLTKAELNIEDISLVPSDSLNIATFYDIKSNENYYFVQSNDFIQIKGYRGFTNLGIVFNQSGKVMQVNIISSQDTASYVRRIRRSKFFNQFIGFNGKQNLDIISGATVTTKAINETVTYITNILHTVINQQKNY